MTVFADGPTRVLYFSDVPNLANQDADLSILDLAARLKQVCNSFCICALVLARVGLSGSCIRAMLSQYFCSGKQLTAHNARQYYLCHCLIASECLTACSPQPT